jgi:hypothetical protein
LRNETENLLDAVFDTRILFEGLNLFVELKVMKLEHLPEMNNILEICWIMSVKPLFRSIDVYDKYSSAVNIQQIKLIVKAGESYLQAEPIFRVPITKIITNLKFIISEWKGTMKLANDCISLSDAKMINSKFENLQKYIKLDKFSFAFSKVQCFLRPEKKKETIKVDENSESIEKYCDDALAGENIGLNDAIDTELYCLCRQIDDGSPMITCDRCEEWFHWSCAIGISQSSHRGKIKSNKLLTSVADLKDYICISCSIKSNIDYKYVW